MVSLKHVSRPPISRLSFPPTITVHRCTSGYQKHMRTLVIDHNSSIQHSHHSLSLDPSLLLAVIPIHYAETAMSAASVSTFALFSILCSSVYLS